MTLVNHPKRRSLPREYTRSADVDSLAFDGEHARRGGGGGRGGDQALQAWQLPPKKAWGTVIVCGQVKPRLCAVVS